MKQFLHRKLPFAFTLLLISVCLMNSTETFAQVYCYLDNDMDGFGDPNKRVESGLLGCPLFYVSNSDDCDDNNRLLNPDTKWYPDLDGDGFPANYTVPAGCTQPGPGAVMYDPANPSPDLAWDCDDGNAALNPFTLWYQDADGDRYASTNGLNVRSCTQPDGYTRADLLLGYDDCNDADANINAGTIWYKDADNDRYSDGNTKTQCARPTGYKLASELTATSGDCDDTDPLSNPEKIWYLDFDNDGYSTGSTVTQCSRPLFYKAQSELKSLEADCNDNDRTINPETIWYLDKDNDGYSSLETVSQCSRPLFYKLQSELKSLDADCNDNDAAINPDTEWYLDADNDGYYTSLQIGGRKQCTSPGAGWRYQGLLGGGDCSDNDAAINPDTEWYLDADNDGYYTSLQIGGRKQCESPGAGWRYQGLLGGGDCNDNDATYNPQTIWVIDQDRDGYYTGTPYTGCLFIGATGYVRKTTQLPGDCDDNDPAIHSLTWYKDFDGDGYSDGTTTTQCDRPLGYRLASELTATSGDCNDNDASITSGPTWLFDGDNDGYYNGSYIGLASCTSPGPGWKPYSEFTKGVDCDDNDATVTVGRTWYKDADNDGYSDGTSQTQCDRPTGYKLASELTATSGDCDDNNGSVHATSVWYKDADNDGYSDGTTQTQCARPTGYKLASELTATSGDCDDNNPSVHATSVWYKDADNDGYGNGTTLTQCARPTGYKLASELTATSGDCDDNNASVYATSVWYKDADNDGYSDGTTLTQCARPTGYKLASELTATSGDCDDNNASVHATSVWYKDADNDGYSDGITLTQCARPTGYKLASELTAVNGDCNDNNAAVHAPVRYYADADKDGYGNPSKSILVCSAIAPAGYVSNNTDCNDSKATVHPGAVEICGNGIDDNCNGQVDENCCANASSLSIVNITSNNAQVNWTANTNPVQWQLEYKTTRPGSKWVDVLLTGTLRTYQLTSLSSNQNYQAQIRAKCGNIWTNYSATQTFKTLSGNTLNAASAQPLPEENAGSSPGLKLYPNPNNGQFVIQLSVSDEPDGNAKIEMVDVLGRIVQTENASLSNGKLQKTVTMPSQVTRGVYMLRIIVHDKAYQTKLIYQ